MKYLVFDLSCNACQKHLGSAVLLFSSLIEHDTAKENHDTCQVLNRLLTNFRTWNIQACQSLDVTLVLVRNVWEVQCFPHQSCGNMPLLRIVMTLASGHLNWFSGHLNCFSRHLNWCSGHLNWCCGHLNWYCGRCLKQPYGSCQVVKQLRCSLSGTPYRVVATSSLSCSLVVTVAMQIDTAESKPQVLSGDTLATWHSVMPVLDPLPATFKAVCMQFDATHSSHRAFPILNQLCRSLSGTPCTLFGCH